MKSIVIGLLLFFGITSQTSYASDKNLDALAMALVLHDLQYGEIELQEDGNIFDQIKEFIEETKDFLLENFDYNGNGRIDFGEELDDVVQTFKDIVVLLLDTNFNGKIEKEEVIQAVKELVQLIRDEVGAVICVEVIKQAEAAGPWLKFRPILNAAYKRCIGE